MASNRFGNVLTITTWGESHGKAIGVVVDGVPAGIALNVDDINTALLKRAPGRSVYTSPRQEKDLADIYSGVFEGKTTGAPVSIIIPNKDADSSKYETIKNKLRPGHANYTYLQKYGCFDYRGGGRASARETACRVAAGVIAKKILQKVGAEVQGYLHAVADVNVDTDAFLAPAVEESGECVLATKLDQASLSEQLVAQLAGSEIFCPDPIVEQKMMSRIAVAKQAGDSCGGTVGVVAFGLPLGLGDPVYEKLEANLAKAMLSIPATKGFEIGEGFAAATMHGSEHNDEFMQQDGKTKLASNHAGGTLGGISTGEPLLCRVAFKPTSSIMREQRTVDLQGQATAFQLPQGSRHDPCVAIRAVPVVEAMAALVLADALLMNRLVK